MREVAVGDRVRHGAGVAAVEEHAAGEASFADLGLGAAVHPAARLGGPVAGRPRDVLALQRLVGNAAVQRLLGGEFVPVAAADRGGHARAIRRFPPAAGRATSGDRGGVGIQRQAGEPLLRIGSRSPAVAELQQALAAAGFPLEADGIFGPGTRSAVVAFQKSAGLAADGVVGPKTWQRLKGGGPAAGPAAGGGNPQHALLDLKLKTIQAALKGLQAKDGGEPAAAGPGATGAASPLGSLPGKAIPLCGPQLPAGREGAAPQAAPAAAPAGSVQLQRSILDDAASWLDETAESVGDAAGAAASWVGEQAEAAGSWVDEQVTAAGEQVAAAGEWVSEQAGAAGTWVGQTVEDAKQAAAEAVQTVESGVGAGVAAVAETASQLGQDVQALGDDLRKRYAKEIAIVEQVIQELGKPFGGLDVGGLLRQMDDVLKQLGGADPKAGFFGLFEPDKKPPSKVYGLLDLAATIQQGGVKVPTTGYSEPKFGIGNITWWRVDDETVVVQATLNVDCRWEIAGAARGVSISGPDDPAVTEISYQTIVSDLKQLRESYKEKGVTTSFWARQLVERHEVFHCHDYITRAGNYLSTARAWLEEQTVSEDPGAGDTESQLKALLEAMRKKVEADNLEYFNNGGEERAFGDGLGAYNALIDAICARAKKAKWKGCNEGHCGGE